VNWLSLNANGVHGHLLGLGSTDESFEVEKLDEILGHRISHDQSLGQFVENLAQKSGARAAHVVNFDELNLNRLTY